MDAWMDWLLARGRLSRGQFWLRVFVLGALFYALWEALGLSEQGATVWVVNLPVLALMVSLCVRRLHDRNYAGWWLLVALVPVAGALWLVWQLALRRGLPQENRWGADPVRLAGDFLTVR